MRMVGTKINERYFVVMPREREEIILGVERYHLR